MRKVVSKKALEIINTEVEYHKDLGYDHPPDTPEPVHPAPPPPLETGSLVRMLASVFLYRLLSVLLILGSALCLLAALAHVHADSIAQSYPGSAPHLEVLAAIVEQIMVDSDE